MRPCAKALAAALILVGLLAGCKVELYSNLDEHEANEMLAVLLQNGVDADKVLVKDQIANIEVEKEHVARAIELLRMRGLPREKFSGMGDMFQKEGLISTPAEERARFIYALSQELSQTLLGIDGVIGARVHLVLPENDPRKPNAQPSSAAVLIKHNGDPLVGDLVPQIKELVTNSIEGLSYDKVTVVLFENRELGSEVAVHELHDIFGLRVDPSSVQELWVLIGALGTLMVATLGLAIAVILTGLRRRGQAEHGG